MRNKNNLNQLLINDRLKGEISTDLYNQLKALCYSNLSFKKFIYTNNDNHIINELIDNSILYLYQKWDGRANVSTYLYTILSSKIKEYYRNNSTIKANINNNSFSLDNTVDNGYGTPIKYKDLIEDDTINLEIDYIENDLYNIIINKYPDIINTDKDKLILLSFLNGYKISDISFKYNIPIHRIERFKRMFKDIGLETFKKNLK